MNKSMLVGVGIGVVAALALASAASVNIFTSKPQYAQVIAVKPVTKIIKTPRQQCHDVFVTERQPVQDEHRVVGSVLGAVAGGVIGHQFGGGRGRDASTVAGALGGGYVGHQAQERMQNRDTYTRQVQKCNTVYDSSKQTLGYDVTYKIGEQQGQRRMNQDPGTQIPLDKSGNLILPQ